MPLLRPITNISGSAAYANQSISYGSEFKSGLLHSQLDIQLRRLRNLKSIVDNSCFLDTNYLKSADKDSLIAHYRIQEPDSIIDEDLFDLPVHLYKKADFSSFMFCGSYIQNTFDLLRLFRAISYEELEAFYRNLIGQCEVLKSYHNSYNWDSLGSWGSNLLPRFLNSTRAYFFFNFVDSLIENFSQMRETLAMEIRGVLFCTHPLQDRIRHGAYFSFYDDISSVDTYRDQYSNGRKRLATDLNSENYCIANTCDPLYAGVVDTQINVLNNDFVKRFSSMVDDHVALNRIVADINLLTFTSVNFYFGLPNRELLATLNEPVPYRFLANDKDIKSFRRSDLFKELKENFNYKHVAGSLTYCPAPTMLKFNTFSMNFWHGKADKPLDSLAVEDVLLECLEDCSLSIKLAGQNQYVDVGHKIHSLTEPFFIERNITTFATRNVRCPYAVHNFVNLIKYYVYEDSLKFFKEYSLDLIVPKDTKDLPLVSDIESIWNLYVEDRVYYYWDQLSSIYESAIGSDLSDKEIAETNFKLYYQDLSNSQGIKLRQAINKGEVNVDVLNNQPMTLYLLLTSGLTVKRIKQKKNLIFEDIKWNKPIPKWLLDKLTAPITDMKDFLVQLHDRKNIFALLRTHWAKDDIGFSYILNKEPKLFADMSLTDVRNVVLYDMAVDSWSLGNVTEAHSGYFFSRARCPGVLQEKAAFLENLKGGRFILSKLYKEWSRHFETEDLSLKDKLESMRNSYWKSFCSDLKTFLCRFLLFDGGTKSTTSNQLLSTGEIGAYNFKFNLQKYFFIMNDMFAPAAFAFGSLTGSKPTENFETFWSFIKEMNVWWDEANRNMNNRDSNADFYRTEAYINNINQRTQMFYYYEIPGDYNNQYYTRDFSEELKQAVKDQVDLPSANFSVSGYKAAQSLLGSFIYSLNIPSVDRYKNAKKDTRPFSLCPSAKYFDNYKFEQIVLNEDLIEEGRSMHHCVANYSHQCREGTSYIYHVSGGADTKNDTSTVEFNPQLAEITIGNEVFTIKTLRMNQNRSYTNSPPTAENSKAVTSYMNKFNKVILSAEYHLFNNLIKFFDYLSLLASNKRMVQSIERVVLKTKGLDIIERGNVRINIENSPILGRVFKLKEKFIVKTEDSVPTGEAEFAAPQHMVETFEVMDEHLAKDNHRIQIAVDEEEIIIL